MSLVLEKGTLWYQIVTRTQQASAAKSLHTIETRSHQFQQQGLNFTVRIASNLKRKQQQKKAQPNFNPFLPPESALTVCDLSASHLAVLNKFNVVDNHLLIITRDYQAQETLLDHADFSALCYCLPEYPSLGFYNGGKEAGASQKHKHLQLVPLPLYRGSDLFPFSTVFHRYQYRDGIQKITEFPFRHAWTNLPQGLFEKPDQAAAYCLQIYQEMLNKLTIKPLIDQQGKKFQSVPYNLLMTTEWMLLVPRVTEFCEGISINAMGYVGSLFVMNQADLKKLINFGPVNLLRMVSL
jgi:ATP adenylyltransferase